MTTAQHSLFMSYSNMTHGECPSVFHPSRTTRCLPHTQHAHTHFSRNMVTEHTHGPLRTLPHANQLIHSAVRESSHALDTRCFKTTRSTCSNNNTPGTPATAGECLKQQPPHCSGSETQLKTANTVTNTPPITRENHFPQSTGNREHDLVRAVNENACVKMQDGANPINLLETIIDSDTDWTAETKYYLSSVPLTKTVPGARSTRPSILIHPLKPQWAHVPVTLLADPDGKPVGPNSAIELHIWKSTQTGHSAAAPGPSPAQADEAPRKGHKKKAAAAPGDQPAARRSRSVESSPANP